MKTKKQLRKPENWQDFESLCKKLWGEIWRCPEIKKNGRVGQSQFGVDVYGIPHGETSYYGIQCKGKDDYTDAKLTETEINSEIKKAKLFQPALKKYYIVTTANKDVGIEEFVRKINIEHINDGLFEVHLFSWEDIVDLIEENPITYNYYVNSKNFRADYSVLISFNNDEQLMDKKVIFMKAITHHIYDNHNKYETISVLSNQMGLTRSLFMLGSKNRSLSDIYFRLKVLNNGDSAIEKYKLCFSLDGDYKEFDVVPKGDLMLASKADYNVKRKSNELEFINNNDTLVPNDVVLTDELYIKPDPYTAQRLVLNWQLLSLNYSVKGQLNIDVIPEIKEKTFKKFVQNGQKPRVETKIIDYFAEIEK